MRGYLSDAAPMRLVCTLETAQAPKKMLKQRLGAAFHVGSSPWDQSAPVAISRTPATRRRALLPTTTVTGHGVPSAKLDNTPTDS